MQEYLNLYDENKELTEDIILRKKDTIKNIPINRYYMVVYLIIENLKGELLFQLTSESKHSEIALTGGHVKQGSDGLNTVIEETKEELGITLKKDDIELIQTIKLEQEYHEVFYIKSDIKIEDMKLDPAEVTSVKYYTKDEIKKLLKENKIRKSNRGIVLDYLWKCNVNKIK